MITTSASDSRTALTWLAIDGSLLRNVCCPAIEPPSCVHAVSNSSQNVAEYSMLVSASRYGRSKPCAWAYSAATAASVEVPW